MPYCITIWGEIVMKLSVVMKQLVDYYSQNHQKILAWVENKFVCSSAELPLFSSIDIRNSGYKTAHVDLNLFPSGFNNLSADAKLLSTQLCSQYLKQYYSTVSKIVIYPEQFSRNQKYLESLTVLCKMLSDAGYEVSMIWNDDLFDSITLPGKIRTKDLGEGKNEIVILNNDLTDGVPEFLVQYNGNILPSPTLGWHSRRKSEHFLKFNQVVGLVAAQFNFDAWLISNYKDICTNIDFRERKNLECIARAVDRIIAKTRVKYNEYGINGDPYVFVKSNQGTFGLGITTARSGEEILQINKKRRHSMQKIKLGIENNQVLIQEGVPTISKTEDGHTAEEMVYSVFAHTTCIFNRINAEVDEYSSLNSRGATFDNCRELPASDIRYLINKLANIATVYEEY